LFGSVARDNKSVDDNVRRAPLLLRGRVEKLGAGARIGWGARLGRVPDADDGEILFFLASEREDPMRQC
jgi:hypothetical protein